MRIHKEYTVNVQEVMNFIEETLLYLHSINIHKYVDYGHIIFDNTIFRLYQTIGHQKLVINPEADKIDGKHQLTIGEYRNPYKDSNEQFYFINKTKFEGETAKLTVFWETEDTVACRVNDGEVIELTHDQLNILVNIQDYDYETMQQYSRFSVPPTWDIAERLGYKATKEDLKYWEKSLRDKTAKFYINDINAEYA